MMVEDLTVYIGDNVPSFYSYLNSLGKSCISYKEYGKKLIDTVYVRTTEYSAKDLYDILYSCKELIYFQPTKWTDPELESHTVGWLELIATVRSVKIIKAGETGRGPIEYEPSSFPKLNFLDPVDTRKTDDKQLWIIGCSFANGHGLSDVNQRYGQLIADKLNLPVSFLTITGASNQWAADQIIKSDIRKGDVVIWCITGIARSTIYTQERVWPITIHLLDKSEKSNRSLFPNNKKIAQMKRMLSEEFLLSDHSFYDSINHIEQVVNFLEKCQAEFIIGYFADIDSAYFGNMGQMMRYIIAKKDPRIFVVRPEYPWADIIIRSYSDINNETPSDDESLTQGVHHPGPRQHAIYANDMLSLYSKLYQ